MPTLGRFIQRRRQELGMTQEELAERIGDGVRQSEISRLEHDHITLPRRERLEALAVALDVSIGALLVRSGWAGADEEFDPTAPPPESLPSDGEPVPDVSEMLQQIKALVEEVETLIELDADAATPRHGVGGTPVGSGPYPDGV
jgi:transcriptional regulator with XRE-family HTH domain